MMLRTNQLFLLASLLACSWGFQAPSYTSRRPQWTTQQSAEFRSSSSDGRVRLLAVEEEVSEDEFSGSAAKEKHNQKAPAEKLELPPVIQSIADERREFQLKLGKAMDTLRSDMREILQKKPDFSIYDDDIRVLDPSGVQLKGLDAYKSAFAFFQTFCGFWFHTAATKGSAVQFRMVYDFARAAVRISWNAVLVPKIPFTRRPLFVDGVSLYTLDASSGMIVEHKVEKLVINNRPVAPPYGILSLLQQDALTRQPNGVPVGVAGAATSVMSRLSEEPLRELAS